MADHIESTATQVRQLGSSIAHVLAATITDPVVGHRRYKTECHRYLYNDEGAILTTRPATCWECKKVDALTIAEAQDAALAAAVLVGAGT